MMTEGPFLGKYQILHSSKGLELREGLQTDLGAYQILHRSDYRTSKIGQKALTALRAINII